MIRQQGDLLIIGDGIIYIPFERIWEIGKKKKEKILKVERKNKLITKERNKEPIWWMKISIAKKKKEQINYKRKKERKKERPHMMNKNIYCIKEKGTDKL